MRVTQTFLLFPLNSFFFVYRHSDLKGSFSNGTKTRPVNLVVACGPYRFTRSDIGPRDLKHLRKGIVERMLRVLRKTGLRVVSLSPCVRGGGWGVKKSWNRYSSILAFETSL
jgi:hypothetical protein